MVCVMRVSGMMVWRRDKENWRQSSGQRRSFKLFDLLPNLLRYVSASVC